MSTVRARTVACRCALLREEWAPSVEFNLCQTLVFVTIESCRWRQGWCAFDTLRFALAGTLVGTESIFSNGSSQDVTRGSRS